MAKTKAAHQYSLCKHEWERHPWKGTLWRCVTCGQCETVKPATKRPKAREVSGALTLPMAE